MALQGYLGAFYAKVLPEVIDNCDENWDAGTHGTPELDTGDKKEGTGSVKIVVADAVAGDILATNVLTSMSLVNHRRVQLWIKSSVTTALGDLCFLIDETASCGGSPPEEVIDVPALTAGTWTQVTLTLAAPADLDAVISVGIEYNANPQDCNIWVDDINAISSLTITDEAVGTGDGSETEFDLDNPNIDLDSLEVKVDGDVVKDYEVTVKGHITFVTAPGNELDVTASYTYWVVAQAGGFRNWSFSLTGDTAERTDFSSSGWKTFVGILKGWTGSAEQFWLNEKWSDELANLVIVKFYEDVSNTLRYEGWARLSGVDVSSAVDTLIMSPITLQGTGVLSYESS